MTNLNFENKRIRRAWFEEEWFFSIVDIVAILTENDFQTARNYWKVLKHRLTEEGNESVTNCNQLKMQSSDGKYYMTDVGDTKQILRLIQSIPSKKAEPFKLWLAKVGSERLDEAVDPEISIDRAIQNYRKLGYDENWINQRIKSIEVRKALTDEWDKSGVKQGKEYSILTDLMYKTWADMTNKEYKEFKGLKKENLRDNMTNVELILNMLAEASATELSEKSNPFGLNGSARVAISGAEVARDARLSLEEKGGEAVTNRKFEKNNDDKKEKKKTKLLIKKMKNKNENT